jgi:hypothetical protein
VVRVVCVGWATLDKRLKEFTRTPVALLTPGEFESHADEAQKESEELIKRLVRGAAGGGGGRGPSAGGGVGTVMGATV